MDKKFLNISCIVFWTLIVLVGCKKSGVSEADFYGEWKFIGDSQYASRSINFFPDRAVWQDLEVAGDGATISNLKYTSIENTGAEKTEYPLGFIIAGSVSEQRNFRLTVGTPDSDTFFISKDKTKIARLRDNGSLQIFERNN
jgi:hypothetical protein